MEYIRRKSSIHLVKAPVNKGYAAGNNLGLKILKKQGGNDFYWILNNDTVVRENALAYLLDKMKSVNSSQATVINQTLMHDNAPEKIQAIGGKLLKPWMHAVHIGANKKVEEITPKDLKNVDYPVGASLFFNAAFIDVVGFMEEGYFLYFEEIDWMLNARKLDAEFIFCCEPIVFHKHGASTDNSGGISTAYSVRNRVRYAYRNEPLYFFHTILFALFFACKKLAKREWHILHPLIFPPHKRF